VFHEAQKTLEGVDGISLESGIIIAISFRQTALSVKTRSIYIYNE
jgi:hypothetical protein